MVVTGGIAGVAVGLAAVYGIGRLPAQCGRCRLRPAVELAQRIAPLARGEVAALRRGRAAAAAARSRLSRCRRGREASGRLARPHRAVQPVGHLVRALPQGDAGARRARRQARRARLRGGGGQYRHPRSRQAAQLAQGGRHRPARPTMPTRAPRCFRISRSPARAAGMPTTLLSIRPAARSAPWRARPNGRARTRSSWFPPRSGVRRRLASRLR